MRTLSFLRFWNFTTAILAMCCLIVTGNCETAPEVVIQTLEIKPSHDGVSYEGKFRFLNRGRTPIELHCAEEPINQRFLPNDIMFQVFESGIWKKVPSTGVGNVRLCDIPPGTPVELHVNLESFKEQEEPLKARVVFNWDQFPSEPFTLDWKSDRKAGKFREAKKAHAERLRAGFIRSGFRADLLKGDDFPERFVNGLIGSVTRSGEVGKLFEIYDKKGLEIDASMTWKGDVRIIFNSIGGPGTVGILEWSPGRLNRSLIEKLGKTDGIAEVSVDEKSGKLSGFVIAIVPDYAIESGSLDDLVRPFELTLSVSLAENEAESLPMPKQAESEKAFVSVMDYLKGCLTK